MRAGSRFRISARFSVSGKLAGGAPPAPQLGAHASSFHLDGGGGSVSPQVVEITSQAVGSSLLTPLFGQRDAMNAPVDSRGNTPGLLGDSGYAGDLWAPFGMEAYAATGISGGASHSVSVTKTSFDSREQTLILVEARGSGVLQDFSIRNRAAAGAGVGYSTDPVTTTGRALLVSAWGGDGGYGISQDAAPEAGWTMIESLFLSDTSYIQAAVAVRQVGTAGDYSCPWTPVANQGAIVSIFGFQA